MIKIITGVRRCGKSFLLSTIYSNWLRSQGIKDTHIIEINLEDRRNKNLRDPDNLLNFIDSKLGDNLMHYIIIDEIQHVPEFEDVLNSYLNKPNVDVYVTGSNARFLSKDVITTFRGRGDVIELHPLSFSEMRPYLSQYDDMALNEYLLYGGMPQIAFINNAEDKTSFLKALFVNTYIRDIVERYKIKNTDILEDLLNILASDIGVLTNPTKLVNTFESVKHEKVNRMTLTSYLEYICDSFLMERASRYDLKGKKYIDSPYKYYFVDCGLRNAKLNFRQTEPTHLMENLIYNELRIRGFNVDVGVVPIQTTHVDGVRRRSQLEVDFVCNLGNKRYYIQSAYRMPDEEKRRQEEASLRNINDSFKKIIIVGEHTPILRNDAGITTISIYDFLLNENSLDI